MSKSSGDVGDVDEVNTFTRVRAVVRQQAMPFQLRKLAADEAHSSHTTLAGRIAQVNEICHMTITVDDCVRKDNRSILTRTKRKAGRQTRCALQGSLYSYLLPTLRFHAKHSLTR